MEIRRKISRLLPQKYFEVNLILTNAFLSPQMTKTEIEILAYFLSLREKGVEDIFNTYSRSVVKREMGNMSSASLSNHLRSLRNKEYILKDEETNRLKIVEFLIPNDNIQRYDLILKKEDENK